MALYLLAGWLVAVWHLCHPCTFRRGVAIKKCFSLPSLCFTLKNSVIFFPLKELKDVVQSKLLDRAAHNASPSQSPGLCAVTMVTGPHMVHRFG